MPFPPALIDEAMSLLTDFRARGLKIATAESCTGGLVAALLTEIPGSSDVVERGFVVYSNEAKAEMLGVDPAVIAARGAVSEEVAAALALGVLEKSRADISVSITGVAGPGGGSAEKPVGLVWFGCARRGGALVTVERRFGPLAREAIRLAAVNQALSLAMAAAR